MKGLQKLFLNLNFPYLSQECSQWQQYQKLLQARQQCLTVQEVPPANVSGDIIELDAVVSDHKPFKKAMNTNTTGNGTEFSYVKTKKLSNGILHQVITA
jgi:hypothetical protein